MMFHEKKPIGCAACKHNEMGICTLAGKEIGISFILRRNQGLPSFCPKEKGNAKPTPNKRKKHTGSSSSVKKNAQSSR